MAESQALQKLQAAGDLKTIAAKKPKLDEKSLLDEARKAGLTGKELAAFMAQMAHESGNFRYAEEIGGGKDSYKGGKRYKGRGYIQLTHDYNYKKYGDRLGIDLLNNPERAAEPDIAAKIALLYWKDNVAPRVKNWDNVFEHSRAINYPAAKTEKQVNGMKDRKAKYEKYSKQLQETPASTNLPKLEVPAPQTVAPAIPVPAATPAQAATPAPEVDSAKWDKYKVEMKQVEVDGKKGQIPLDKLDQFLQDNPGATVLD